MAALVGLALLLGAKTLARNINLDVITPFSSFKPFHLYGTARHDQNLPGTHRDVDQNLASTLTVPNTVRAPFGPNPQSKYINAWDMIDNPLFAHRYQKNIKLLRADEPDWRLDVYTNSSLNNFGNYHSPEAPYGEILMFSRPDQQPIEPFPVFT